jgi:hypothetical protein
MAKDPPQDQKTPRQECLWWAPSGNRWWMASAIAWRGALCYLLPVITYKTMTNNTPSKFTEGEYDHMINMARVFLVIGFLGPGILHFLGWHPFLSFITSLLILLAFKFTSIPLKSNNEKIVNNAKKVRRNTIAVLVLWLIVFLATILPLFL